MPNEHDLMQQRVREKAYQLWEQAGRPAGAAQRFWFLAKVAIEQVEAKLDTDVAQSFPASDPPSSSVVTGATGDLPVAADAEAPSPPETRRR